jgi:hypothetical protein
VERRAAPGGVRRRQRVLAAGVHRVHARCRPNERLQEANAVIGLSRRILSIAGPAIGALIVAAGSPAIAIAIDGLTFVVSALLVWSMRVAAATRARRDVRCRRPARRLARVHQPAVGRRDDRRRSGCSS